MCRTAAPLVFQLLSPPIRYRQQPCSRYGTCNNNHGPLRRATSAPHTNMSACCIPSPRPLHLTCCAIRPCYYMHQLRKQCMYTCEAGKPIMLSVVYFLFHQLRFIQTEAERQRREPVVLQWIENGLRSCMHADCFIYDACFSKISRD